MSGNKADACWTVAIATSSTTRDDVLYCAGRSSPWLGAWGMPRARRGSGAHWLRGPGGSDAQNMSLGPDWDTNMDVGCGPATFVCRRVCRANQCAIMCELRVRSSVLVSTVQRNAFSNALPCEYIKGECYSLLFLCGKKDHERQRAESGSPIPKAHTGIV